MAKIEIYTAAMCPFCVRAVKLLQAKGQNFEQIDVTLDRTLRQHMMRRAGGSHTVPQIFINDDHIGGCDDLYRLERAGHLDGLLAG